MGADPDPVAGELLRKENNGPSAEGGGGVLKGNGAMSSSSGKEDSDNCSCPKISMDQKEREIEEMNVGGWGSWKLPILVKIGDGCGHVLNDLCASLWFSYLLLYLQNVVKLGTDTAAGLLLWGQVVDAVATPLIGYAADQLTMNCFFCKPNYGQCKSWHLLGCIFVVLSFPFIFSPVILNGWEEWGDWGKFLYYAPFVAVFQVGWASTQVSHLALLPKITPNQLLRTELLAIRYGFTVVSNLSVFIIAWLTFGFSEKCVIDPDDHYKFKNLALFAVTVGTVFVVFYHVIIKENHNHTVRRQSLCNESQREIQDVTGPIKVEFTKAKELEQLDEKHKIHDDWPANILSTRSVLLNFQGRLQWNDWLALPQFYVVGGIYMATRLSVNLTQVYVPIYLQDSLGLPCGTVATIPLTMYISGFVMAFFIKPLNKYMGRQLSYMVGASLSLLGSLFIITLDWQSSEFLRHYGIYGVAALLGGGASAILVTSLSITADLIGRHVENSAFVYGVMSFSDKLSCGLVVVLINSLLPEKNIADGSYVESHALMFYRDVVGYACGGCATIGVILVLILTYGIYREEKKLQSKPTT